jgi:hypothetical protein
MRVTAASDRDRADRPGMDGERCYQLRGSRTGQQQRGASSIASQFEKSRRGADAHRLGLWAGRTDTNILVATW